MAAMSSLVRRQLHDLSFFTLAKTPNMIGPHRQRDTHFFFVDCSIVGPGNATPKAAGVIEQRFDDMWCGPQITEMGGKGPAQIVC
jgi:hypothetical protein